MNFENLIIARFKLKTRVKILKTNIREIEQLELDIFDESREINKIVAKIDECLAKIDFIDEKMEVAAGFRYADEYKTSDILDMFQHRI